MQILLGYAYPAHQEQLAVQHPRQILYSFPNIGKALKQRRLRLDVAQRLKTLYGGENSGEYIIWEKDNVLEQEKKFVILSVADNTNGEKSSLSYYIVTLVL